MSISNGITAGTPSKILFGAGVYFKGVTFDEKVAPTEEVVKKAVIGATQEGGTLTITPEFFTPPLDGAMVPVMELQQKVGETAEMEVSFAELSADLLAHMAIANADETTDKKFDVITSAAHLAKGHGLGNCLQIKPGAANQNGAGQGIHQRLCQGSVLGYGEAIQRGNDIQ